MSQPQELDAHAELGLGVAILTIAITAQGVTATSNVGYVLHQFGVPMLAVYLAATAGILLFPYLIRYAENVLHFRISNVLLTVFIAWITIEENFHASHGWKVPEGAVKLAGLIATPEYASQVVMVALILLSYVVLEFLSHLLHLGIKITHTAHHKIRHTPHKG